jgi:hypothetical protein
VHILTIAESRTGRGVTHITTQMLELSDIEEKALRAVLGALGGLEHAGRASVLQLAHLMHKLGIGNSDATSSSTPSKTGAASAQVKRLGRPPGRPMGRPAGRPMGRPAAAAAAAAPVAAAAPTFQATAHVKGRPGRPPGSGAGKPGRPPGRPAAQASAPSTAGSLKQFVSQKKPAGALQRTAVLGYYLHQNNKLPSFSNAEIDQANKESGSEAFSNVHVTVNNAIVRGLIERADRGKRRLTPAGRAFVEALPDRSKAQASVRELLR